MLANNDYYTCTRRKAFKTGHYKACKKLTNSISLEDSINYVSLRILNTGVDSKSFVVTHVVLSLAESNPSIIYNIIFVFSKI